MADFLLHFRSLYNTKIPKSVPYVATTVYNIHDTKPSLAYQSHHRQFYMEFVMPTKDAVEIGM